MVPKGFIGWLWRAKHHVGKHLPAIFGKLGELFLMVGPIGSELGSIFVKILSLSHAAFTFIIALTLCRANKTPQIAKYRLWRFTPR
jgi:hypothetical protein